MPTTDVEGGSSLGPLASLTPLYLVGICLAAVTGTVHLWLRTERGAPGLLVAGIGFAVGIAAVLGDVRRHDAVRFGVPFTAMQVVLYAVAHFPEITWTGAVDKVVQIGLVAVPVVLARRNGMPVLR